ncbi:hypothetical protein Tco_1468953, partial [Tanacetum coccineum]
MPRRKFNALAKNLEDIMMESLPKMVDERIKKILQTQVSLHVATTPSRPFAVRPREQDDPHDDAHPKGENNAKRQKISEYGTFETGGSSSSQDYESESGPSTLGNQEQSDDFDYWTDSYTIDDDVLLNEKASQELVDEISQTVDEVKLRKVVDEMLSQQCSLGDEHHYHIDKMKNFLKSDIVWESMKEIIVPPYQPKPTPVIQSCQRDPKAPGLSLVNQVLLYLKKGNSGPDKIVLSLHKFPAVIFPDDDIEERTSRRIVGRRANGSIVSITESDYKNLNKNDIEDMYLLIINHKVDDYAETGLLWSLSVFIRSTVIWERVNDFQLGVERYQQQVNLTAPTITFPGIEKVLEELKSYNNDVKYGYVTHNLSKEDIEYLEL